MSFILILVVNNQYHPAGNGIYQTIEKKLSSKGEHVAFFVLFLNFAFVQTPLDDKIKECLAFDQHKALKDIHDYNNVPVRVKDGSTGLLTPLATQKLFSLTEIGKPSKFTKETEVCFEKGSMRKVQVLSQIDSTFICSIVENVDRKKFLVIIDSHAAHERILLEKYQALYYSRNEFSYIGMHKHVDHNMSSNALSEKHCFKYYPDTKTLEFPKMLRKEFNMSDNDIVTLYHGCLSNCRLDPIYTLLASKACRNAIKFGTKLDPLIMKQLILDLMNCKHPFQCAHGRPSLYPIKQL